MSEVAESLRLKQPEYTVCIPYMARVLLMLLKAGDTLFRESCTAAIKLMLKHDYFFHITNKFDPIFNPKASPKTSSDTDCLLTQVSLQTPQIKLY